MMLQPDVGLRGKVVLIFWMVFGLASALMFLLSPLFGAVTVAVGLAGLILRAGLRRVWAVLLPERQRFLHALERSVEVGPVSSGLLPCIAFFLLVLLTLSATTGVRL